MPRRLVLVPLPFPLVGPERIDGCYPRSYSEADMRGWAMDLDRALAASNAEIARLDDLPSEMRSVEEQRMLQARRHFLRDPVLGVRGTLRDDGAIEIDAGRHRAAYVAERGSVLPVWVSCSRTRRLEEFAARCEQGARSRSARSDLARAERGNDDRKPDRV